MVSSWLADSAYYASDTLLPRPPPRPWPHTDHVTPTAHRSTTMATCTSPAPPYSLTRMSLVCHPTHSSPLLLRLWRLRAFALLLNPPPCLRMCYPTRRPSAPVPSTTLALPCSLAHHHGRATHQSYCFVNRGNTWEVQAGRRHCNRYYRGSGAWRSVISMTNKLNHGLFDRNIEARVGSCPWSWLGWCRPCRLVLSL